MARTVVAPDRVKWRVHRQWAPWRVRFRKVDWREYSGGDWSDVSFFDEPDGALAGLAVIATVMVVFLVIFPIVAIALELIVLLFILVFAVAARVVLRRPWTIRAVAGEREQSWQVVGWRASRRRIAEVAEALEGGAELPPGAVTTGEPPRPLAGPGATA